MENDNLIFKTKIWRCGCLEVKLYLLERGYCGISFPQYLEKEKCIKLISESKYEVESVVDCTDIFRKEERLTFKVVVNIVGVDGNWECISEECDVDEGDEVCEDRN